MPKEEVEAYVTNPMLELYKGLTKKLQDNGIIAFDMAEDQQKLTKIIDSIITLQ